MQAWRTGCGVIGTATTVQSEWHTQCSKEFNRHRAMPNLSKVSRRIPASLKVGFSKFLTMTSRTANFSKSREQTFFLRVEGQLSPSNSKLSASDNELSPSGNKTLSE